MGNFESLREHVGAGVALHLEISGDGRHGLQGADLAAVDAVAPGAVVLAVVVDADAKGHQSDAAQHQQVGQIAKLKAAGEDGQRHGDQGQRQQEPMTPLSTAGDDGGVQYRQQEQRDPGHPGPGTASAINGHHPHGDGGLIELLVATEHYDEHVQQGCCDGQNDLAPRIQRIPGPFQTGGSQAGHCRANHAECHQPGQNAFAFDIKMVSSFHNIIILPIFGQKFKFSFCNKNVIPSEPASRGICAPIQHGALDQCVDLSTPLRFARDDMGKRRI